MNIAIFEGFFAVIVLTGWYIANGRKKKNNKETAATNKVLPKAGATCYYETFVLKRT